MSEFGQSTGIGRGAFGTSTGSEDCECRYYAQLSVETFVHSDGQIRWDIRSCEHVQCTDCPAGTKGGWQYGYTLGGTPATTPVPYGLVYTLQKCASCPPGTKCGTMGPYTQNHITGTDKVENVPQVIQDLKRRARDGELQSDADDLLPGLVALMDGEWGGNPADKSTAAVQALCNGLR